ncbi:ADP-ribose pyrophosphatase, mitochondrial-like isoform X1 [Daphnia carinata]|uniref:ADP-ribose pyrophosphatase, mitochondrial-like isoform X1 n=2 Tax=Daphnia carinata TaxID=120202 RepID=UPI0028691929|nr:ADP-ribose pyrophosphatase, mitochondrial-like isoform X1 [Daphnia carinata]
MDKLLSRFLSAGLKMPSTAWKDKIHTKCRGQTYPRSDQKRCITPDDKVKWSVPWPEYNPTEYTSPSLQGQPWADLEISEQFAPTFNQMERKDDHVVRNRVSYVGDYKVINGYPINPVGRTGIKGRGLLGHWGPNHAADFIVTRWLRDRVNGQQILNEDSKKPILQFIGIQRRHGNEWAIPGGMVDAGEEPDHAAQREFLEEAMNSQELDPKNLEDLMDTVQEMFDRGITIYEGYVDDPRNTDNAWMETTAINCHSEHGCLEHWPLQAGSDAKQVSWLEITSSLNLYASHIDLIELVANHHKAHW